MNIILIANAISLIGAGLMILAGLIKSKRNILLTQCIQFTLMGVSNFLLGGISGTISNVLSILRNLFTFRWTLTPLWKFIFIAVQAGLTIVGNTLGWLGWIPVVSVASLTLILDTKNEILLKAVIIFGLVLWVIFDLALLNYVSAAFDVFAIVTNLIGIRLILRQRKAA